MLVRIRPLPLPISSCMLHHRCCTTPNYLWSCVAALWPDSPAPATRCSLHLCRNLTPERGNATTKKKIVRYHALAMVGRSCARAQAGLPTLCAAPMACSLL